MCNPALAAGVIAQGAGIAMQDRAYKKARNAREEAFRGEGARQDKYYAEAQGAQDTSRDMFDRGNFDSSVDDETARLASILNNAQRGRSFAPAVKGSAPAIVADAQAAAMADAAAYNTQQNDALAELNALGSYLANYVNPQLSSSANTTQMAGNFMRGSSGALQGELEAANQKAYSPMAQLLMAGGQVGTSYGLAKPT